MKELTAEQLLEYRGIVSQFAKTPSLLSDAEQLASLREAILQLGLAKDDGYLDDFRALVFSPEYSQLPEKEWLHSTICRLLPPAVKAEDVPLFAQVISSGDYARWVREQATMTLSARYQLKQDLNKEIAEAYLGIMTGKFSKPDKWHIALSIICTGLCIGGKVLKKAAADFYENYGKELKDGFPPMVFNAIMNMPPEQIRETIGKNTTLGLDNEEEERKMIANPELPDESELERVMKPAKPIVRAEPKINRNDPCPCGSGKKYKKCCGK